MTVLPHSAFPTLSVLLVCAALWPAQAQAADGLSIRAEPAHVILGQDEGPITLHIRSKAPPSALHLHSTTGTLGALEKVGDDAYKVLLTPPQKRFPQLAVVSVAQLSEDGSPPTVVVASVAYSAAIELKGRVEPGAKMTVVVAGKKFGPVRADAEGRFAVPIVVPPGEAFAQGIARDDLGNTSKSKINLYLPEVHRLHAFMFPERVIAGSKGSAWLYVTTLDGAGRLRKGKTTAKPTRGQLGKAVVLGPGRYRYAYEAPAKVGKDPVDHVQLRQGPLRRQVSVALVAGPPADLRLVNVPQTLVVGSQPSGPMEIWVQDAMGNGVAALGNRLEAPGLSVIESSAGRYLATLPTANSAGTRHFDIRVDVLGHTLQKGFDIRDIAARSAFLRVRALPHEVAGESLFLASVVLEETALDGENPWWQDLRVQVQGGKVSLKQSDAQGLRFVVRWQQGLGTVLLSHSRSGASALWEPR